MKVTLFHSGLNIEIRLPSGQSIFNKPSESSSRLIERVQKIYIPAGVQMEVRRITFLSLRRYSKTQLYRARRNATGVERMMFDALIKERLGGPRCRVDEPRTLNQKVDRI